MPARRRATTTTPSTDPDQLVGPAEASRVLGVDPKTVARWADAGVLTAQKTVGGHRRYRLGDLLEARDRLSALESTESGDEALELLRYLRELSVRYATTREPIPVEVANREGADVLERVLAALDARRRTVVDRQARDLFAHLRGVLDAWTRAESGWVHPDGRVVPVEQARARARELLDLIDLVDPAGASPQARDRAERDLAAVRDAVALCRDVTARILAGEELPFAEVRAIARHVGPALDVLDPPEVLEPAAAPRPRAGV